jgi:hypothetical protein
MIVGAEFSIAHLELRSYYIDSIPSATAPSPIRQRPYCPGAWSSELFKES